MGMQSSCRTVVRKAKVKLELNLARDAKSSKKEFYGYACQKKENQRKCTLLISKAGILVTVDEEKAEVLRLHWQLLCPQFSGR